MIRKLILFALPLLSSLLMTVEQNTLHAFECVAPAEQNCLQCHTRIAIHNYHFYQQGLTDRAECLLCHCGDADTSACEDVPGYGPVETVCCALCHEKCPTVINHTYGYFNTTTTLESTTSAITTTSSTETTTSTTVEATTTAVDSLALCLPCHADCEDTTTVPVQYMHNSMCRKCHSSGALHAQPGHSNCGQCHSGGIPRAGNVEAGACTAMCHPTGNPGTCGLVHNHDAALETDCRNCHEECITTSTTTTMPECDIIIMPPVDMVYSEQTFTFTAETSGEGCLSGIYQWELNTVISSRLDADGTYTSGFNNAGQPVTDTIIVEDTVNDIILEWPIVVRFEKITRVVPTTLWRSKWVMLPQVMNIQGEGTHFNNERTAVIFSPSAAVLPSWQTVVSDTLIWNYLLVMPAWYAGAGDQEVMLMVITDDEVLSQQVTIDQFPLNSTGGK